MVSIAKATEAPTQSNIDLLDDEDDKSLKELKQGASYFYVLSAILPCGSNCTKQFSNFLKNPLKLYTFFLACTVVFYYYALPHGGTAVLEDLIGYNSCILEAYGLISVFRKIQNDRSVIGISGNSLIMFVISYGLRQCEALLMSSRFHLTKRAIALELLQFASIPLVLSLLWAVYKTYRETYQESLDKLKVQYLLPACIVLAFTLTPQFRQGEMYSYCWSISFYVDVLALLPQVAMMTFSPGKKVAVPIANFVFATAISRIVDLWFWYFHFDLGPQGWWMGFNFSGYVIVGFHLISLILVADFMYFYLRARCSAYQGDDKQAVVDEARGVFSI